MTVITNDHTPSPDTLAKISGEEVYDESGLKHTFGSLVKGKRVVVIFIRHFWCGNCQTYVRKLSREIGPDKLPPNTSIIIIGCGSYNPIQAYKKLTESAYPIYANPSLGLHKALGFSSKMSGGKTDPNYLSDQGGAFTRVLTSLRDGPMKNIGHVNTVGPKGQNGGEMVIEQDGSCSFFHRMEHAADHLELTDLAKAIGADHAPAQNGNDEAISCDAGVKV